MKEILIIMTVTIACMVALVAPSQPKPLVDKIVNKDDLRLVYECRNNKTSVVEKRFEFDSKKNELRNQFGFIWDVYMWNFTTNEYEKMLSEYKEQPYPGLTCDSWRKPKEAKK